MPVGKGKELELFYDSIKKHTALPQGLLRSFLLTDMRNPEIYKTETIWENQEALDRMKSGKDTPADAVDS